MVAGSDLSFPRWQSGESFSNATTKVVCVGRNYTAHAAELNNPVPSEPILFIKPSSSITPFEQPIRWPEEAGECHIETEVALLVGRTLSNASPEESLESIAGLGVGFDLTLRTLQGQLKEKGHPWERAKAFDGSCPLSAFIPRSEFSSLEEIGIELRCNESLRQSGNSRDMLWGFTDLLSYISRWFRLVPGDVVLTGTPSGVFALNPGDQLEAVLDDRFKFLAEVSAA